VYDFELPVHDFIIKCNNYTSTLQLNITFAIIYDAEMPMVLKGFWNNNIWSSVHTNYMDGP
jgi:hypothetical protein